MSRWLKKLTMITCTIHQTDSDTDRESVSKIIQINESFMALKGLYDLIWHSSFSVIGFYKFSPPLLSLVSIVPLPNSHLIRLFFCHQHPYSLQININSDSKIQCFLPASDEWLPVANLNYHLGVLVERNWEDVFSAGIYHHQILMKITRKKHRNFYLH